MEGWAGGEAEGGRGEGEGRGKGNLLSAAAGSEEYDLCKIVVHAPELLLFLVSRAVGTEGPRRTWSSVPALSSLAAEPPRGLVIAKVGYYPDDGVGGVFGIEVEVVDSERAFRGSQSRDGVSR